MIQFGVAESFKAFLERTEEEIAKPTTTVDLGAERVAALLQRPEPAPDEPLRRRDAPKHVDEHADGVVRDVGGVDRP